MSAVSQESKIDSVDLYILTGCGNQMQDHQAVRSMVLVLGDMGRLACLNLEPRDHIIFPKLLKFENCEVVSIHANGDHSAALSADGKLCLWGTRFSGRSHDHPPQILPSPLRITQVALGWNHALVLTDNGVYMFGG